MNSSSSPPDSQVTLTTALAGRYTITRELGRGGMATVYLADDRKHQRQVAIKVLLPELGAVLGAERFLSEIRVTANLQHPNLLPLFDSGDAGGLLYYVMPYVEGETLRARLDREQQLPVEEAVRLARTMASALDYAHQRGVIHRDLKPENVLLQAGQPVIADFGIALAVAQAGGQRVTQTGLSLGTPQYMSPEQATGDKQLDGRTDIYALGAMTYEMLTGEPPHVGNSAQAIIAKLMTEEVRSLTVLRKSVPVNVDAAVRRALEKLPADRFATAGAFAMALGDGTVSAERYAAPQPRTDKRVAGVLAGALFIMTAVAGWSFSRARATASPTDAPVVRFALKVDPDGKLALGGAAESEFGQPATNAFAMSPSGDRIVYAAWDSLGDNKYRSHLYMRRMDGLDVKELAGTEGAAHPVFSPDGKWLAFTSPSSVLRMNVTEGSVQTVAPVSNACCLAWDRDNTILFSDSTRTQLWQVAASGGHPARISFEVPVDSGTSLVQPLALENGTMLLFHARNAFTDSSAIYRLDRTSGKTTRLLADAADPRVIAHAFLLFMRRGALMAVRFDDNAGTVHGEPVVLIDSVTQSLNMPNTDADLAIGAYAVSAHGDLVYAPGGGFIADPAGLVLVRSAGRTDTVAIGLANIYGPRMSPTEDRIAFYATASPRSQAYAIFVHDRQRRVTTKIAEGGSYNAFPEWSADGQSIAFSSSRAKNFLEGYVVAADGRGLARRVVTTPAGVTLSSWSASGLFAGLTGSGNIVTARADETPTTFFKSSAHESYATFSPDGQSMAYATGERDGEVFVRPFPTGEPALKISAHGGMSPAWSPDGKWLYYLTTGSPQSMVRVAIAARPGGLTAGLPSVVISRWIYQWTVPNRNFDVLRDGSFVTVTGRKQGADGAIRSYHKVTEFRVVLNFLSELRARVH